MHLKLRDFMGLTSFHCKVTWGSFRRSPKLSGEPVGQASEDLDHLRFRRLLDF